jgi:hypothetical protein
MFKRPHLNGKKLGVVVCTCHPSYMGSIKEEDSSFNYPGKK